MNNFLSWISENKVLSAFSTGCIFVALSTAGFVVIQWKRNKGKRIFELQCSDKWPKDTVILHQIGSCLYAPSLSPFAVKMETYLRLANIPYENVHGMEKSEKGKWPWISYNGQRISDSAFIIDFLNEERNINLNSWLCPKQRGVALAFRKLVEDDLYWIMLVWRWIHEPTEQYVFLWVSSWFTYRLRLLPKVQQLTRAQGMGLHSKQDVEHIARKDFQAINDFLGQKKFLMGDWPCEEDCAVFGQLSQFYWQMPTTLGNILKEEFPKLAYYCERMRETVWPDWEQCTTQGGVAPATK